MGKINERTFNEKHPGKKALINTFLREELKRLKQIGFPEYHISNIAARFTKNIINILEEN